MSKDVQFNLRIPAELKAKIEDAAKTNNRSINAEAINRLEKTFSKSLEQAEFTHDNMYFLLSSYFAGLAYRYEKDIDEIQDAILTVESEEQKKQLSVTLFKYEILKDEAEIISKDCANKAKHGQKLFSESRNE